MVSITLHEKDQIYNEKKSRIHGQSYPEQSKSDHI
jgi:hypothetical protein